MMPSSLKKLHRKRSNKTRRAAIKYPLSKVARLRESTHLARITERDFE